MTAMTSTTVPARGDTPAQPRGQRPLRLIERNVMIYRRARLAFISGFFEPLLYLLSIGFGVGSLVGTVRTASGATVDYAAFVGPALLASAAMNDAVFDTTFTMFAKLRYARTYDAVLATPLMVWDIAVGETAWIVLRTTAYASVFLAVLALLGLVHSPWALLILPATLLIGFTFAGLGMVATTAMRNYDDWEFVQLSIVPMFLFSTTLYPLSIYPGWLAGLVSWSPLYHGVSLVRDLSLGDVHRADLGHLAYLVVLGTVALVLARRRLEQVLVR